MTQILFMRHGQPDYSEIDKRKYVGFGNDLASLTENGVEEIKEISKDESLKDVDLILCSPYTRTMHTAAVISKMLDKEFKVELDLMEWIPDKTYMYDDYQKVVAWRHEYDENNGIHTNSSQKWEEKAEIQARIKQVLSKYTNYSKILVITHGMIMNAMTGIIKPSYGQIVEYLLDTED